MDNYVNLLKEFGFTESEAKVYISLLRSGACTGYEASKISGVPRSKIYNILESLMQKGALVSAQGEKTVLYRAEPMKQLTSIIRNSVNDTLNLLEAEADKMQKPRDDEQIWHLYDYYGVKNKCLEMVRQAKKSILVQIWVDDLDDEMADWLNHKREELGKVLVVLYDSEQKYNTKLKKFFAHGYEEDKLADIGSRWILVTADNKEVIYSTVSRTNTVDAIRTKNASMVFFAGEYVMHDAYCLRLIDHLREPVKSEFGVHMEGVRDIFSL